MQIDGLVYELGVYPAEPRRMVGNDGRLREETSPPSWDPANSGAVCNLEHG